MIDQSRDERVHERVSANQKLNVKLRNAAVGEQMSRVLANMLNIYVAYPSSGLHATK